MHLRHLWGVHICHLVNPISGSKVNKQIMGACLCAPQGKSVYPAINRMHGEYMRAGPPTSQEGLRSILVGFGELAGASGAWGLEAKREAFHWFWLV